MATHRQSYQPLTGAKKLVIKNRRQRPTETDQKVREYFDKTWADLSAAIDALLHGKPLRTPLDRLYRGVEAICRDGQAERLCKRLSEHTYDHLRSKVYPVLVKGNSDLPELETLNLVVLNWNIWMDRTKLVRSMFSYLDRTYLQRSKNLLQLNDLVTSQFCRIVFPSSKSLSGPNLLLGTAIIQGVCKLTDYHRWDNGKFNSILYKDSISMLHQLGVYTKIFERKFLDHSSTYFAQVAKENAVMPLIDYIVACNRLLTQETERCDVYGLDHATRFRLSDRVYQYLLREPLDRLMDYTSIGELFDTVNIETLKILYTLMVGAQSEPGPSMLKELEKPWRHYIIEAGGKIMRDTENAGDNKVSIVPRLLLLRRSLYRIVNCAFGSNDMLAHALRDSFGTFINDTANTAHLREGVSNIGEFVARYMDLLLRGGVKAIPPMLLNEATNDDKDEVMGAGDDDSQLDYQLNQALQVFRLIDGKDAFEAFYKRDLARRLLMDRSISYDAERTMLARLRSECGVSFTHNLENMFRDKEMNKGKMDHFKAWCEETKSKPKIELQVLVLSAAAWPTYPDIKPTIPLHMAQALGIFETYYKGKHTGRILTWKHSLANCVVKARFPKGIKELNVSLVQASILLLFNEVPDGQDGFITYSRIAEESKLDEAELKRTLQSLACGKFRVLTKHPKGREVEATDTFTINSGFSDPKFKIKINQIQLRETAQENKKIHERIVLDRRLETQAAIVRIMKSRKRISHSVLVAEVINMMRSRGTVDPAAIKKEIESLLDKDYLERDGNEYEYVA
ncbi:hypothetical protein Cpir12675_005821 [Ceratocystis pirilliformis]|uniref:Cullin family profile domain-containing protein n=1 Tax=Ceratocystis pirilliformis TaxID=259994 RepID=A0ABR3YM22_9PEZI